MKICHCGILGEETIFVCPCFISTSSHMFAYQTWVNSVHSLFNCCSPLSLRATIVCCGQGLQASPNHGLGLCTGTAQHLWDVYILYLTETIHIHDIVNRPRKVSHLAPLNNATIMSLCFYKEDIVKASRTQIRRLLLEVVDMLRCWIISHTTGSHYVVHTFIGGFQFKVCVHAWGSANLPPQDQTFWLDMRIKGKGVYNQISN